MQRPTRNNTYSNSPPNGPSIKRNGYGVHNDTRTYQKSNRRYNSVQPEFQNSCQLTTSPIPFTGAWVPYPIENDAPVHIDFSYPPPVPSMSMHPVESSIFVSESSNYESYQPGESCSSQINIDILLTSNLSAEAPVFVPRSQLQCSVTIVPPAGESDMCTDRDTSHSAVSAVPHHDDPLSPPVREYTCENMSPEPTRSDTQQANVQTETETKNCLSFSEALKKNTRREYNLRDTVGESSQPNKGRKFTKGNEYDCKEMRRNDVSISADEVSCDNNTILNKNDETGSIDSNHNQIKTRKTKCFISKGHNNNNNPEGNEICQQRKKRLTPQNQEKQQQQLNFDKESDISSSGSYQYQKTRHYSRGNSLRKSESFRRPKKESGEDYGEKLERSKSMRTVPKHQERCVNISTSRVMASGEENNSASWRRERATTTKNSEERSTSSSSLEKKFGFIEMPEGEDLFTVPNTFSLAHCVGADFSMGMGIATIFRERFGRVEELKQMKVKVGGVVSLVDGDRHIFYLVTKKYSTLDPYFEDVQSSIIKLKEECERLGVKQLAMPRLSCGLDKHSWEDVRNEIKSIFAESEIEIRVYYKPWHRTPKKSKEIALKK